jgi:acyl-CoA thioesterase-1
VIRIRLFPWLLLLLPAWATAASEPATPAPVILVAGDSLSAGYGIDIREGWVSLLQQRLKDKGYPHTVVNASVSGETTAGGRTRLPALLKRHHPAVVIIELGGNDGLRGLSLAQTRANINDMIAFAKTADARVLLVGIHLPPNYGPDYTHKFHAIYEELGAADGVALVPFLLEGVALTPGLMQDDGLHPRAAAQPRLLDNVWPVLDALLRPADMAGQSCPDNFP